MTANTLEERRRYINEIKASFQDPSKSQQYQDISGGDGANDVSTAGFLRLRLLIAVALFAAFVYCDQNKVKIHTYTTDKVYEYIQMTVPMDQIIETMKEIP